VSFLAGTLIGLVGPVFVVSGVLGLVIAAAADIDPGSGVVVDFVNFGFGLAAKNCLETLLGVAFPVALPKQES